MFYKAKQYATILLLIGYQVWRYHGSNKSTGGIQTSQWRYRGSNKSRVPLGVPHVRVNPSVPQDPVDSLGVPLRRLLNQPLRAQLQRPLGPERLPVQRQHSTHRPVHTLRFTPARYTHTHTGQSTHSASHLSDKHTHTHWSVHTLRFTPAGYTPTHKYLCAFVCVWVSLTCFC